MMVQVCLREHGRRALSLTPSCTVTSQTGLPESPRHRLKGRCIAFVRLCEDTTWGHPARSGTRLPRLVGFQCSLRFLCVVRATGKESSLGLPAAGGAGPYRGDATQASKADAPLHVCPWGTLPSWVDVGAHSSGIRAWESPARRWGQDGAQAGARGSGRQWEETHGSGREALARIE